MKVPARFHHALYRAKRSEFHGLLFHLESVEEMGEYLKAVRKEYHQARHICWAYRVYENGGVQEHASDAGEPSGTAGGPILNVLRQFEVVNGVVYVARIFGGIKLGRQGLRTAYASAVDKVLKEAPLKPWVPWESLMVEAPLDYYGDLVQVLGQVDGRIRVDESGNNVHWRVEIPARERRRFQLLAEERTQGQVEIKGWAGTTKPRR